MPAPPRVSRPAARSRARHPTTALCISAASPTPTATTSSSAGSTRPPRPPRPRPMVARDYGQFGGVARAVELVGERWALLIVRDLLVGPRRYGELAAGLPRIPTNILAAR